MNVQPHIYHLHFDVTEMPKDLEKKVFEELGFVSQHFIGHPEGYIHFEPVAHLTKKVSNKQDFKRQWTELVEIVDKTEFKGYLEGEFIASDEEIPYSTFDESVPVPFKIQRRLLTLKEEFRQTEFHLVMDKDNSDPRLIRGLLEAGLFGAYMSKEDHTGIVLSAQGYLDDIRPIMALLKEYLTKAGGAAKCTLKEEIAVRHKLYGITTKDLPEIVESVMYF